MLTFTPTRLIKASLAARLPTVTCFRSTRLITFCKPRWPRLYKLSSSILPQPDFLSVALLNGSSSGRLLRSKALESTIFKHRPVSLVERFDIGLRPRLDVDRRNKLDVKYLLHHNEYRRIIRLVVLNPRVDARVEISNMINNVDRQVIGRIGYTKVGVEELVPVATR